MSLIPKLSVGRIVAFAVMFVLVGFGLSFLPANIKSTLKIPQ